MSEQSFQKIYKKINGVGIIHLLFFYFKNIRYLNNQNPKHLPILAFVNLI